MNVETRPDPERLLEALVDAGVLRELDDELAFSDAFRRELERTEDRIATLDADELQSTVNAATGSAIEADTLLAVSDRVPAVVAEYLALAERTGLTHTERLQTLPFFDTLVHAPKTEGAPAAFVPVSGERLPFYVELHERAIVYVWRHDCQPCDQARGAFDEIFDGPPDDLALFAVYGPDVSAELYEWYDVVGGPATVFFYQGDPEARMYGSYARSVFETEIERHQQLD